MKKKRKEKTKWGEFVTPVFLSCKDTLCPDMWVHEGHLRGHPQGTLIVYIVYCIRSICLQFNIHYQPAKSGFSLVAEQRSNLLRKSRSPKFFQEKLNQEVRQSTTGTVHWEAQSFERSSPLRGAVHWEGQSSERSSPLKVQCGENTSQVQFSERGSPPRGPVHWEAQSFERGSPLRGAVLWEVQCGERQEASKKRILRKNLKTKGTKIPTRQKTVSFQ